MLPLQFFGQNLHFAISMFAALVFFAVFWLYFDAWSTEETKLKKDFFKWLGFLLVSLSFVVHGTLIDQSVLGRSTFGNSGENISNILRLLGYLGIILGLLLDPIQKEPKVARLTKSHFKDDKAPDKPPKVVAGSKAKKMPLVLAGHAVRLIYGLPVGAAMIALLYWRRATTGLERHLKPVATAFSLLFIFELTGLASVWQNTTNPELFNWIKPFGPLWMLGQFLLLASVIVLGLWVWKYLVERFMSQLFMVFASATLVIFLLTTVSFTFLLTRSVQDDALNNLQTADNVLGYAIGSKKAETAANAGAIAQNPLIEQAVVAKDHKSLVQLTSSFLETKKLSSLVVTTNSAQVLLRAEDPDRWGSSISSDTLVRRALLGNTSSTITTEGGVLAPLVSVKSTVPIRDPAQNIVGTVSVSLALDNAFVDGIKNSTQLDSSIYSGDLLSATTFVGPDGHSRQIGAKEANSKINGTVIGKSQTYKGSLSILNRPYLVVFAPLKDVNNTVVGMLFIGQPQSSILDTAGHSIELTFLVAAALLILSIIPAYLVAKHLSRQLD